MKSLNEIVAELRMGDDGGKPAYRIGRADKVEVSMPSGTPVRSYVIECVTIKELADWIEAAVARERGPGNAAAMYEALVKIAHYCDDENGMDDPYCADGHILSDIARAALSTPPRNCDLRHYNNATIDECSARAYVDHLRYCETYGECCKCPMNPKDGGSCLAKYLLSPAEGVAK